VVRLTAEEDQQLSAQAAELGLTPAAFLRLAALKKLPKRRGALDRETQKAVWSQVAGMARNLNQLTKYAHSGKLKPGELEGLTRELRVLVRQVLEMAGTGPGAARNGEEPP
jgi:hypothetical protein